MRKVFIGFHKIDLVQFFRKKLIWFKTNNLPLQICATLQLTPAFHRVLFGSFETVKHQAQQVLTRTRVNQLATRTGHGQIDAHWYQEISGLRVAALYSYVDATAGAHDIKSTQASFNGSCNLLSYLCRVGEKRKEKRAASYILLSTSRNTVSCKFGERMREGR